MAEGYDFNSSQAFYLSLATMTFGFFSLLVSYALKSKCHSVKLCGCIHIERDIEAELQEDMMVGVPPLPNEQQQPSVQRQLTPQDDFTVNETTASQSRRQSRKGSAFVDFATSMTQPQEQKDII